MRYFDLDLFRRLVRKYPFLLPILTLSAAAGLTGIAISLVYFWQVATTPGTVTVQAPPPQPVTVATAPRPAPAPAEPPPKAKSDPKTPASPKPQPPADLFDADRGVIVGDVYVRATAVRVDRFDVYGAATYEPEKYGGQFVFVDLELKNLSETKKVDFDGWNGVIFDRPVLEDEFGNKYDYVSVVGMLPKTKIAQRQTVHPGETCADSLRFPAPVSKAKELRLTLPRDPFGQGGVLRLRIPVETIRKANPN